MSQVGTEPSGILVCDSSAGSRRGLSLYGTAGGTPQCCVWRWASQCKKDMEALERVQGRERSCEGSEHSAVGTAEGMGWVSVEKRSSGESSTAPDRRLWGGGSISASR